MRRDQKHFILLKLPDMKKRVSLAAHRRLRKKETIQLLAFLRYIETSLGDSPWYKKIFQRRFKS
jgi:hypothetical protein